VIENHENEASENPLHSHLGSDEMANLEDSKIILNFRVLEGSTTKKGI
jgi:hypothetical protein